MRMSAKCQLGRAKHLLEQRLINDIVVLMDPQRLQQIVFVIFIFGIQFRNPLLDRRDDRFGFAASQLDPGAVARAVFGLAQQVE